LFLECAIVVKSDVVWNKSSFHFLVFQEKASAVLWRCLEKVWTCDSVMRRLLYGMLVASFSYDGINRASRLIWTVTKNDIFRHGP
jgi:hypothetical protein